MKKLLSILATVAVTGSSASAVVACGTPYTKQTKNDTGTGNSTNNSNSNNNSSSSDNGEGWIHDGGKANNSGSNTNNGNSSSHNGSSVIRTQAQDEAKVKDAAQRYAAKKILEDQYGIDGDYLDSQLGWTTNPETADSKPDDNMSNTGEYGSSAFPLIDYLSSAGIIDSKLSKTLKGTILPMLFGSDGKSAIDVPTPTELGSTISGLMPVLSMFSDKLSGLIKDPDEVKAKADAIFTPQVKRIVDAIIAKGNTLDSKYDTLKVKDLMNSLVIGVAYIIAKGTDDTLNANEFINMQDVKNWGSVASKYIVDRVDWLVEAPSIDGTIDDKDPYFTDDSLVMNLDIRRKQNADFINSSDYQLFRVDKDKDGNETDKQLKITSVASAKDSDGDADLGNIEIKMPKEQFSEGSYKLVWKHKVDNTAQQNSDIALTFDIDKDNKVTMDKDSGHSLVFDFNKILNDESGKSLGVVVECLQLLNTYINAFDPYKLVSQTPDANHIFEKDGKLVGNYEAVNTVKEETVSDLAKNAKIFNIFKFASNISYYLGSLDQPEGAYKLQAFFAMFFLDDDKSGDKKFIINWDNNGSGVSGWDDKIDGESKNMTPFSSLITNILQKVLGDNEPDIMNQLSGLLGAFKLSWSDIITIAEHNSYIVLQSLVWNRGFSISDKDNGLIKLSDIDNGITEAHGGTFDNLGFKAAIGIANGIVNGISDVVNSFPGLRTLDEWKNIEDKGIISYLFNGNAYNLLTEAKESSSIKSFLENLGKMTLIGKKKPLIKNIDTTVYDLLDKVFGLMGPFTLNTPISETINLSESFDKYEKIVISSGGKTSVINTKPKIESKPSSESSEGWGSTNHKDRGANAAPSIDSVVVRKYDESTNTYTIEINASKIAMCKKPALHKISGNNGKTSWTADDFANAIKIDGNSTKVISTNAYNAEGTDGNHGTTSAKILVSYSGNLNSNSITSANAWRFLGDDSDWLGVKTDYWDQKTVSNSAVNFPISRKDDVLDVFSKLGIDTGDYAQTAYKVDESNFEDLPGLSIIGYKDDNDKKGKYLINGIDTQVSKGLNLKDFASQNLSWLLGLVGLKGFDAKENPLGLPVADSHTLGSLILEIGKLVNTQDLDALNDDMKLSNFQNLANVIFGLDSNQHSTGEGNIVDRLVDALSAKKSEMASKLSDALGITDTANTYSKDGLLGALMDAFTPSLMGAHDPDSDTVTGNSKAKAPLWTYIFNTVKTAWMFVNDNDNKEAIMKLNEDKNYAFDWFDATEDGNTITVNVTYNYTWTGYPDKTPTTEMKHGSYKLTIKDVDKDTQWYKISKN